MNNLVAYGDDSDDESPRRRSTDAVSAQGHKLERNSASPRPRRNSEMFFDDTDARNEESPGSSADSVTTDFAEPPPPKRPRDVHSPSPAVRTPQGMMKVSSVCSLVSYAGDTKDEAEFDKAEREGKSADGDSPPSGGAEPRPPARVSQESDSDEDNEVLINQAIDEVQRGLKELQNEDSSTGSMTPQRDVDSPQVMDVDTQPEDTDDSELKLPPSPPGECDPALQRKFEFFFERKANGMNFNRELQTRREFLNPSCYETFIDNFDLKEKGSNFDPAIFDPFSYPESCYYDAIGEEQRKMMEAAQAKAGKKAQPPAR